MLSSINTILHERQLEEYYCTLCYAVFDLKRRTVTLANSGVPYPIRASGDTVAPIELPGVPLGSFFGVTYDEVTFPLASGDVFVFCSDGVSEAMNSARRGIRAPRVSSRSCRPVRGRERRRDRRRHRRRGGRSPRRLSAQRRHDRRRPQARLNEPASAGQDRNGPANWPCLMNSENRVRKTGLERAVELKRELE